jgi:hypothetical protein
VEPFFPQNGDFCEIADVERRIDELDEIQHLGLLLGREAPSIDAFT